MQNIQYKNSTAKKRRFKRYVLASNLRAWMLKVAKNAQNGHKRAINLSKCII